jgi:hypothetical protein
MDKEGQMARKKKSEKKSEEKVEAVDPSATVTVNADLVTIEDLSYTPPIRAHGADENQAWAAYEYQIELRSRHDAQAEVPAPGIQTSDLTPGRVA